MSESQPESVFLSQAQSLLTKLGGGARLQRLGAAYVICGRRGPRQTFAPAFVAALAARGWLTPITEGYVRSPSGKAWLSNEAANPHAGGTREWETRLVTDEDGREHYVLANAAESPLTLLARRGKLTPLQFQAGEKLRRDYTMGQLSPRLGVDYSAPVGSHSFRPDLADTVVAARQRFNRAMMAVGPGLSSVLFDVCCYLKTLDESEKTRGWPRSSVRVVLGLALDRLAAHYGMGAPETGALRRWSKEDGDE